MSDTSRYIDFINNTMAVPHRIDDSDLYYFLIEDGVEENAIVRYERYKQGLTGEESSESARRVRDRAVVIFAKEDPAQSYEDFVQDIKAGRLPMVGGTFYSPINNNFDNLDMNGNLLLKTRNSRLEDFVGGFEEANGDEQNGRYIPQDHIGDILIDRNGVIVRKPTGSMIIHEANKYGFYPVEVYKNNHSDRVETFQKLWNFLTPDGHLICKEGFSTLDTDETAIEEVPLTYHGLDTFTAKDVYPTAYVCAVDGGLILLPNAQAVIDENNARLEAGLTPLTDDISTYESVVEARSAKLDSIREKYVKAYESGKIFSTELLRIVANLSLERRAYNSPVRTATAEAVVDNPTNTDDNPTA